jgi:hypothetical protein
MPELDELRDALRARESMAPETADVLAAAGRRIRRRRVTSVVAAVVVTIAGLGAGAAAVRHQSAAPELPVAAPGTTTLSAQGLPFSIEDRGYRLLRWETDPHQTTGHYVGPAARVLDVTAYDHDPGRQGPPAQWVSWHAAPERWISLRSKQLGQAQLLAVAGLVKSSPTPSASPLRSLRAPQGYQLDSWFSEPASDTVVLCPGGRRGDAHCASVLVSRSEPQPLVKVPGSALLRQLDAEHWVQVTVAAGDQALAGPIADSVVTN